MESSGKTRGLAGALLVLLLLCLTGWAAYAYYHSAVVRTLTHKSDEPLYIAVLTQPAMTVAYNPHTRKAIITTVERRKIPTNPKDNAQDLFQLAGIQTADIRYYIPQQLSRDSYWERAKKILASWHNQPFLILQLLNDYLQAYRQKRTNIPFSEFLLYALEATQLEITDFTVRHTEEKNKKKSAAKTGTAANVENDTILPPVEDRAPLAVEDRPLILEILNASGVKGAALELTQYLRQQNQKGILHVDVLQYDNFPGGRKKQTRIINYKGQLNQLKQLSAAIGLNNEIVSEKQDTAICDARIIIGEDFKQPL